MRRELWGCIRIRPFAITCDRSLQTISRPCADEDYMCALHVTRPAAVETLQQYAT